MTAAIGVSELQHVMIGWHIHELHISRHLRSPDDTAGVVLHALTAAVGCGLSWTSVGVRVRVRVRVGWVGLGWVGLGLVGSVVSVLFGSVCEPSAKIRTSSKESYVSGGGGLDFRGRFRGRVRGRRIGR